MYVVHDSEKRVKRDKIEDEEEREIKRESLLV